jgi:hypothetical protein
MIMALLQLLIWVAILGLIAWAVLRIVPMPDAIRTVVIVIVALIALLLVLQAFGLGVPWPIHAR